MKSAVHDDHIFSITSKIGWLSIVIIAAAWGNRLLPDKWQSLWGEAGVAGLAAALGLAAVAVVRRHKQAPAEQQV
jgi:hypothetical protein